MWHICCRFVCGKFAAFYSSSNVDEILRNHGTCAEIDLQHVGLCSGYGNLLQIFPIDFNGEVKFHNYTLLQIHSKTCNCGFLSLIWFFYFFFIRFSLIHTINPQQQIGTICCTIWCVFCHCRFSAAEICSISVSCVHTRQNLPVAPHLLCILDPFFSTWFLNAPDLLLACASILAQNIGLK